MIIIKEINSGTIIPGDRVKEDQRYKRPRRDHEEDKRTWLYLTDIVLILKS